MAEKSSFLFSIVIIRNNDYMASIWKHFKIGDIVINRSVWGSNKRFVIDKMYGNAYCPILDVHPIHVPKTNGNTCLFNPNDTTLINAPKRPLSKLKKVVLLKMVRNGNVEAKRELLIRLYNKQI